MNIKLFDIPAICPDETMEQVNKFLRGNKVIDVDRQFYLSSDNVGHWSLLVTYLPVQSSSSAFQERREKENNLVGLFGILGFRYGINNREAG